MIICCATLFVFPCFTSYIKLMLYEIQQMLKNLHIKNSRVCPNSKIYEHNLRHVRDFNQRSETTYTVLSTVVQNAAIACARMLSRKRLDPARQILKRAAS